MIEMSERTELIFKKNADKFIGRIAEIEKYVNKYYKVLFTSKPLLKIERIDASHQLKNVGFRKHLSSWQNSYKNLVVSSCVVIKGVEKRYDYKFYFTEEKLPAEVVERIEKEIQESQRLQKKNLFLEAKNKIDALINEIKDKNDVYYDKRLGGIYDGIVNAERNLLSVIEQIDQLAEEINSCVKLSNLNEALKHYERMRDLSKSIGNVGITEKYASILKNFETLIVDTFEELKTYIRMMVNKGLKNLKDRKIGDGLLIYQEIRNKLSIYREEIHSPYNRS